MHVLAGKIPLNESKKLGTGSFCETGEWEGINRYIGGQKKQNVWNVKK